MVTDGVPLLVYDGDCAFCTRVVDLARARLGVQCRAVPWQEADLAALGLTEDQVVEKVWWVDPDGTKVSGHRAVAAALRHGAPAVRSVGRLLDADAFAPVASAGYDLVARNRHRLPGGTPACGTGIAPEPDGKV
jgi:predicted DCC family thiol-disulfide oxidoreductase YuxK